MSDRASRHRFGFLVTLATGVALLGASFHGMAGVEADLRAAALAEQREMRALVVAYDRDGWDCPARKGERKQPRTFDDRV